LFRYAAAAVDRAERRAMLQAVSKRSADWVCALQPLLTSIPDRLRTRAAAGGGDGDASASVDSDVMVMVLRTELAAHTTRAKDAEAALDALRLRRHEERQETDAVDATRRKESSSDLAIHDALQRELAAARAEAAAAREETAAAAAAAVTGKTSTASEAATSKNTTVTTGKKKTTSAFGPYPPPPSKEDKAAAAAKEDKDDGKDAAATGRRVLEEAQLRLQLAREEMAAAARTHAETLAEERRASLAAVAAERTLAGDALANARREHEVEVAALRARVATLEGECVAARVEAEMGRSCASAAEHRAEAAEKGQGDERARTASALGDAASAAARSDACAAAAAAAAAREDAALAKAQAAELARCVAEGAAGARVETEVARIILARDRAAAEARSSLMAEIAEAKAARSRAEMLAAAAEEHEQEASAGERLRLRAEAAAARKAEAVARRDLDEHRRVASAAAHAAHEQLEDVKRQLSTQERSLEARIATAEDDARVATSALAVSRDAAALEASAATAAHQRRREQGAEEDARLRQQLAVALADVEGAKGAAAGARAREEESQGRCVVGLSICTSCNSVTPS
jgi:hypothetical protein